MKKSKKNKSKGFFSSLKKKITNFYDKTIGKNKLNFSMTEAFIIAIAVFGIGLIIGGVVMYSTSSFKGSNLSLNEFVATYDEIVDNYYEEIDKDELLEAGISGMIRYLGDPYSTYLSKDSAQEFNDDVEGTYQGIGAEIRYNSDDLPIIGRVFENSPAEKVGLKENDIIMKVNDEEVSTKQLSQIADIVKGEKGTSVNITVNRDGEDITFKIVREVVDNISVTSEIIESNDKTIGYIYISVFASNTTKQFEKELLKLEEKNIDSLIIDVRGNSGGYLSTATDIVSLFTKKGATIYQLKTKDKIEIITDETDESRDYPIVVLIDSGSASASELLTGALSETYHAVTVGTKTFGKGKVQKVSKLSSGALFKYTYQEWLTPYGYSVDQVGISADEYIEYVYDEEGKDNQKDRAIEIISE